jgi:UDP-N-acetylmuramate dehydrogenase
VLDHMPIQTLLQPIKGVDTSKYTTTGIGPTVDYFFLPKTVEELKESITFIRDNNLEFYILGGGSNTIIDDKMDSKRAIICLVEYAGIKPLEDFHFLCKSGTSLQEVVDYAQQYNLVGVTGLNRVPGTLGGAVVGNAGAYGTEICQSVLTVTYINIRTLEINTIVNGDCKFAYRDSIFKHSPDLIVLDVVLDLSKVEDFSEEKTNYAKIAIIRDGVYPKGFRSPGSVFKNFPLQSLDADFVATIPPEWIVYNKLPVGKLLESVGSKGRDYNGVKMRDIHANIMEVINSKATYQDVKDLLDSLKKDVKAKWNLSIEPEIRLIEEFRKF